MIVWKVVPLLLDFDRLFTLSVHKEVIVAKMWRLRWRVGVEGNELIVGRWSKDDISRVVTDRACSLFRKDN
ncbi:hypothetical protein TSUD_169880 [Trifolium subterraneum]|nr:hypothetical protein TSUD_169880 [Trifolium subterraneum]